MGNAKGAKKPPDSGTEESLAPNGLTKEELLDDVSRAIHPAYAARHNAVMEARKIFGGSTSISRLSSLVGNKFTDLCGNTKDKELAALIATVVIEQIKKFKFSAADLQRIANNTNTYFHKNIIVQKAAELNLFSEIRDYEFLMQNLSTHEDGGEDAYAALQYAVFVNTENLNPDNVEKLLSFYGKVNPIMQKRVQPLLEKVFDSIIKKPILKNLIVAKSYLGDDFPDNMQIALDQVEAKVWPRYYGEALNQQELLQKIVNNTTSKHDYYSGTHITCIVDVWEKLGLSSYHTNLLKRVVPDSVFQRILLEIAKRNIYTRISDIDNLDRYISTGCPEGVEARQITQKLRKDLWQKRLDQIGSIQNLWHYIAAYQNDNLHLDAEIWAEMLFATIKRLVPTPGAFYRYVKRLKRRTSSRPPIDEYVTNMLIIHAVKAGFFQSLNRLYTYHELVSGRSMNDGETYLSIANAALSSNLLGLDSSLAVLNRAKQIFNDYCPAKIEALIFEKAKQIDENSDDNDIKTAYHIIGEGIDEKLHARLYDIFLRHYQKKLKRNDHYTQIAMMINSFKDSFFVIQKAFSFAVVEKAKELECDVNQYKEMLGVTRFYSINNFIIYNCFEQNTLSGVADLSELITGAKSDGPYYQEIVTAYSEELKKLTADLDKKSISELGNLHDLLSKIGQQEETLAIIKEKAKTINKKSNDDDILAAKKILGDEMPKDLEKRYEKIMLDKYEAFYRPRIDVRSDIKDEFKKLLRVGDKILRARAMVKIALDYTSLSASFCVDCAYAAGNGNLANIILNEFLLAGVAKSFDDLNIFYDKAVSSADYYNDIIKNLSAIAEGLITDQINKANRGDLSAIFNKLSKLGFMDDNEINKILDLLSEQVLRGCASIEMAYSRIHALNLDNVSKVKILHTYLKKGCNINDALWALVQLLSAGAFPGPGNVIYSNIVYDKLDELAKMDKNELERVYSYMSILNIDERGFWEPWSSAYASLNDLELDDLITFASNLDMHSLRNLLVINWCKHKKFNTKDEGSRLFGVVKLDAPYDDEAIYEYNKIENTISASV